MGRKSPRQRSLFGGYSPEPKDPRGRKAIAWTEQAAETVAEMAALGETQEEIAAAVHLSVKTLKRIYAGELAAGAKLIRRAIFAGQVRKAVEGNTPAARFVEGVLARSEADQFGKRFGEDEDAPPAPTAPKGRLGKKAAAQLAAQSAGQDTEWGDDLLGAPTVQ